MIDLTRELEFLIREPLNAASVVMDYVELHFNGSYLRCLEPPTVARPSAAPLTFPGRGSRDALCDLIGATVRRIQAADGGELRAEFSDGSVVTSSLSRETRRSPEVLHIHNRATGETQWW